MRHLLLAYLDPGTGSFVAQIVIGAVVGIGVVVKAFWRNIVGLFSKPKDKDQSADK